jgi:hypothetical protein
MFFDVNNVDQGLDDPVGVIQGAGRHEGKLDQASVDYPMVRQP